MEKSNELLTIDRVIAAHRDRRGEIRRRLAEFEAVWKDGSDARLWEEMVFCFFTGGCSAAMGLRSVDAVRPPARFFSRLTVEARPLRLPASLADVRRRRYPCDDVLPQHTRALFRAVALDAPPTVVFRWLCQLKLAPYSYDLLDNGGRRSPRHLVPGVDRLEVGERVMIFELASFRGRRAPDHVRVGPPGVRRRGDQLRGPPRRTGPVAPRGRTIR